jgi:hypothetical protein
LFFCWFPITASATISTKVTPDIHSSPSAVKAAVTTMPAMMIANAIPSRR